MFTQDYVPVCGIIASLWLKTLKKWVVHTWWFTCEQQCRKVSNEKNFIYFSVYRDVEKWWKNFQWESETIEWSQKRKCSNGECWVHIFVYLFFILKNWFDHTAGMCDADVWYWKLSWNRVSLLLIWHNEAKLSHLCRITYICVLWFY